MKRSTAILAFSALLTVCMAGLVTAEKPSAKAIKVLEVDKLTPKLEVRHSQIGFRDTLLFYTFKEQNVILKLQIGNKDKTFPMTATFYIFQDSVTEDGLKKWLNNQHSDAIFPDVPEPIMTHKAPAKVCTVTSHKLIDRSKQQFGEYDNYAVKFQVINYSDMKNVKLKGFTGETKVHVKTK